MNLSGNNPVWCLKFGIISMEDKGIEFFDLHNRKTKGNKKRNKGDSNLNIKFSILILFFIYKIIYELRGF